MRNTHVKLSENVDNYAIYKDTVTDPQITSVSVKKIIQLLKFYERLFKFSKSTEPTDENNKPSLTTTHYDKKFWSSAKKKKKKRKKKMKLRKMGDHLQISNFFEITFKQQL